MTQPPVFVSYSHNDEGVKEKLLQHLGVLAHAGLPIEVWNDDGPNSHASGYETVVLCTGGPWMELL